MFKNPSFKDSISGSGATFKLLITLVATGILGLYAPIQASAEETNNLKRTCATPTTAPAPITLPADTTQQVKAKFAKGIDISHNNGSVDLAKVKEAGITFVYAKATQGVTFKDPTFEQNWTSAKANNLIRGAYHFLDLDHAALTASVEASAVAQADYFLSTVSFAPGDLPPMLDVEQYSQLPPAQVALCVKTWLDRVAQKTGTTPILYIEKSFWLYEMEATTLLKGYPLWIADVNDTERPSIPSCWSNWSIWQYKSGALWGRTATPAFDIDSYNGTKEQLMQFVNQYGFKFVSK